MNRNIRTVLKKHYINREIRSYKTGQPHTTEFAGGGCEMQRSDCQSPIEELSWFGSCLVLSYKQTLITLFGSDLFMLMLLYIILFEDRMWYG